ncbi:hypothetical protein CAPTEDRAFT_185513 [Capitella teleta]|uniref:Neurotransmitter-gated ion-channel ligand-binding domain-containing protein n=1 Tax=Capitella teleta TaxID=283909 RepID=R7TRK8_CAPTE|nr:hypothetical protein CAPTEDRAFT_185513 [Capitella teleta]|eukprot:ELT96269.1 hypothetical protein CAPTEDRAFT_185513 [Capitella teleta]
MKLILVVFLAGIEMTLGSTTEFIRDLIHPSKYDKNDLPTSGQTNVSIGVYLNNIVLNEKKSSMKVLMYLRQAWKDPRLAHNSNQRQRVPSEFIDQIWRPDTFFRNARTIQLKQEMTDERLMTIDKNGSIWFVQRQPIFSMYVDFACDLNQLRSAACSIMFETYRSAQNARGEKTEVGNFMVYDSFWPNVEASVTQFKGILLVGYVQDDVNFHWLSAMAEVDVGWNIPNYESPKKILFNCSQTYTAGSFTCLEIRFVFQKKTV